MFEATASHEAWTSALKTVGMAVSTRPTLPILANVVLDGTDQAVGLQIHGTDLELFASVNVGGTATDGKACAPAAALQAAMKAIRGAVTPKKAAAELVTVFVHDDGTVMVVGFGRSLRASADGYRDPLDYPAFPALSDRMVLHYPAGDLQDGLKFTLVAAGSDDTLPILTAVKLTADAEACELAATDRYRLAVCPTRVVRFEDVEMLLPRPAAKLLASLDGEIDVYTSGDETDATFRAGAVTVTVRLMYGTFPQYRKLIPSDNLQTRRVDRAGLVADVTAAKAVVDKTAPVHLTFAPGTVTVEGSSPRTAEDDGSDGYLTAFNPAYLIDGLKSFTDATLTVESTYAAKPHILRDDTGRLYLIMPTRLPDVTSAAA
jgi:DNA polymerase-3 subunit beta